MVYKLFDKQSASRCVKNEELAEELHKPIIKKFEKQKVHSSFINNILGTNHADLQLLSKFDKETRFLLCVIKIFIVNMHGIFL